MRHPSRASFPRSATTFAVIDTQPRLRLRRIVRLPGDFSYDALSPDGHSLFLINYLSRADPTKYRVRVYDLAPRRLDPQPIVDPREPPDAMSGLPSRAPRAPTGAGRTRSTTAPASTVHPRARHVGRRRSASTCGARVRGATPASCGCGSPATGGWTSPQGRRRVATVERRTFHVRALAASAAKAGSGGGATQGLAAVLAGVAAALLVLAAGAHRLRVRRRVAT